MSESGEFVAAVGQALRAARYARSRSQRDLAFELGVGKSTVARWESGELDAGMRTLMRVLRQLGFEVLLEDRREADQRAPLEVVHPSDAAAEEVVECWRDRVDDERVLDASGRRPPAHRHTYPIRVPHRWWAARHPRTPWVLRPVWSWSRYPRHPQTVHRLGRHPASVGLPPQGGAAMQGYPP